MGRDSDGSAESQEQAHPAYKPEPWRKQGHQVRFKGKTHGAEVRTLKGNDRQREQIAWVVRMQGGGPAEW